MAKIRFDEELSGRESIQALAAELKALKQDLEYVLTHLDQNNLSIEFLSRNNLK